MNCQSFGKALELDRESMRKEKQRNSLLAFSHSGDGARRGERDDAEPEGSDRKAAHHVS